MNSWKTKGCPVCRQLWESGRFPPEIGVNIENHSSLHRCIECGTYWEQYERYADVITEPDARSRYTIGD
jgi:hypothetical protein